MANERLDGAFRLGSKKIYFFQGAQYYRYDPGPEKRVDLDYPKPIAGNWRGLPQDFTSGIDAALYSEENKKIYLFKGDRYVRYTYGVSCDSGYPKLIKDGWKKWPAEFAGGIDAIYYAKERDKIYAFKGNRYLRYTPNKGCDPNYPKTINWEKWPAEFKRGIDAAFSLDKKRLYFFKGDRYIRHTPGEGCDSGYPKTVGGTRWDGLFGRFGPKRTIQGTVTYKETGQPVEGALVRAWDADDGPADQMGRDHTNADGQYTIRYKGGSWDTKVPASLSWRPDIVVGVFVRARDNQWSRVFKSKQFSNHMMSKTLTVNAQIHEPNTVIEKMTTFDPTVHGFAFDNDKFKVCAAPTCRKEHWEDAFAIYGEMAPVISEMFRNVFVFDWALCGGMSLSALRRFNRNKPPPMPDFSPELKEELIRYQMDTLFAQHPQTWARILWWQARPNEPHWDALHTIGKETIDEWIKVRRELDKGHPKILCLIREGPTNDPADASGNHQVVVIGYRYDLHNNEVEIFVYDPNHNSKTSSILFNTALPRNQINSIQQTPGESNERVRGFLLVEVSES